MNDIIKIVQVLEDPNVLLKGVTKTIKNETKKLEGWYLKMLIGTLASTLLGNMLPGKGNVRAGSGNKKGKRLRTRMGLLMPPHPLANLEI